MPIEAEDLFKEFKEHSVADFFKKNRQMLGLSGKIKSLTTIVHEFVTNSLDACEEAGILPEITIELSEMGSEFYEFTIKDNGPGIPKKIVGNALGKLLAGTKFHRLIQMRGQQGIGASGAVMFSQITTGQPMKVKTGTKKETISMDLSIDTKTNTPKMINVKEFKDDFQGTVISGRYKEVSYRKGDQGVLEYLRRTALANPHATIIFKDPFNEEVKFNRTVKEIPSLPIEVKPHPKGVSVDELLTMSKYTQSRKLSSFLKTDFDRIGDKTIKDLSKLVKIDLNIDPKKLKWEEAEEIVLAFKKITFIAPRLDVLRPIGEEHIAKSMKAILKPEFLASVTRKPNVFRGYPFQIEVAIAYGGRAGKGEGDESKIEIMRYANRAPLLFDGGGCAITRAVQSIEWKRYGISSVEAAPITVFVNLVSVHVPYISAGKQAISPEDEVMEEMRLALMDAGRKIAKHLAGIKKLQEREQKRKMFYRYAPEVARGVSVLVGRSADAIEKKLQKIILERLRMDEEEEEEVIEEEVVVDE